MDVGGAALIAVFVLAFGLVSRRMQLGVITPPMAFVAFGMVMGGDALGWVELNVEGHVGQLLTEFTLVLVLFGDASRIDLRALRRELGLPVRLLLIGLPLTVVLGALVAYGLFPQLGLAGAALLAAILSPTDAALGQAVVSDERIPLRIRQTLNVESGLNDGLVLPLVLALAAVDAELSDWLGFAALQVMVGPAVGALIGWTGALAVQAAKARGLMNETFERLAGVALAVLAYAAAQEVGGNGFLSAFAAGLALGHTARHFCSPLHAFIEAEGQLLMLLVFLALGSTLAWPALAEAGWSTLLYAVLSLTVIRMLPVALSLLGSGLKPVSVGFIAWFGPRGLASLLFGLLIADRAGVPHIDTLFAVVVTTVLLSVLAHGLSAVPASRLYGALMQSRPEDCPDEHAEVAEHRLRFRV